MKKTQLFLLAVILLLVSGDIFAQVQREWIARYNGAHNSYDRAYAIAVDDEGDVCVAGYTNTAASSEDYLTVKYDPDGTVLWTAQYDGPVNGWDQAHDMEMDASGNVYVTGWSQGSGSSQDYLTVKYSANGTQLWTARYNGTGNDWDNAYDLAVDGDGNVYVTGLSWSSGSDYDIITIKYNSAGVQQWAARYNGPGNSADYGYAITVDDTGNVYVTGCCIGLGLNDDYCTIKYDSNGNRLWAVISNGSGNSWDDAYAIAVDSDGNVYVTGTSCGTTGNGDYWTFKIDSNGWPLWNVRYDGPYGGEDCAYDIAVDEDGNVFVTGWSDGEGSSTVDDWATVKYNSNGVQQWAARYDGPASGWDRAYALELDVDGNVYVTGSSRLSYHDDSTAIKYDTNGNQKWIFRYNGTGDSGDACYDIAVDADGKVYITGDSYGSGTDDDCVTIKLRQGSSRYRVPVKW